jgi:tRNA-specific adenosine deaminase 2
VWVVIRSGGRSDNRFSEMESLHRLSPPSTRCSVADGHCCEDVAANGISELVLSRPILPEQSQRLQCAQVSVDVPSYSGRGRLTEVPEHKDSRTDTSPVLVASSSSDATAAAKYGEALGPPLSDGAVRPAQCAQRTAQLARNLTAADPTDTTFNPKFMLIALEIGKRAMERHAEVPVGCLLVQRYSGEIIGYGANRCNELRNATKHAELVGLADVLHRYPHMERREALLAKSDVYVTCEPCIMCTAALIAHGVGGYVYFGCRNERFGGCGTVLRVHDGSCGLPSNRKPLRVSGGHFAQESIALLHRFYEMENMFAPEEKRKVKRTQCKEQASLTP